MPCIEWNESYCIGQIELDSQHKEWIRIINELHANLLSDASGNFTQATTDSLEAMYAYGMKHFAYEEQFMLDNGYPDYKKHKRMHEEFRAKVLLLRQEHRAKGAVVLNSQLMKILVNWLENHILIEDKKIVEYLQGS